MFFGKKKRGLIYEDPAKPGLRRRILNTFLLVLLFRLLANIPIANVDEEKLHELLAHNPLLGAIDLFAGGEVLSSFSIVAVGLFPYLFAAGFVALAVHFIPALHELSENKAKEKRFERYSTVAKVLLAFVLGWGLTRYLSLESGLRTGKLHWLTRSEFLSTFLTVSIVTAGSWFTEKIKDWITDHGIGPGESVILVVGSSLSFIVHLSDLIYGSGAKHDVVRQLVVSGAVGLVVILLSVFLASAERKIPMTPVRDAGGSKPGFRGETRRDFISFPLNRGGNAPVSSALGFIALFQIAALFLAWAFPGKLPGLENMLLAPTRPEHGLYWAALGVLVILFTYVTNFAFLWKPFKDSDLSLAEHLRRQGQFIVPGVRPGEKTHQYFSHIMGRISLPAALLLAFLAAGLPYLILRVTGVNQSVAILAVVVFVRSLLEVTDRVKSYDTIDHAYEENFIKPVAR